MSLEKLLQLGKSNTSRELPLNLQIVKLTNNNENSKIHVVVHVEKEASEQYGMIIMGSLKYEQKMPEELNPFAEKWSVEIKEEEEDTKRTAKLIAEMAIRQGVLVAWFSVRSSGHVVPLILKPLAEVDQKIEYGVLKRHLNLKHQKTIVHINTSYGHHDNLGKCQRRAITMNQVGKVVGVLKKPPEERERCDKKRVKVEECDATKESKMAMSIVKQLVQWFRQIRLDWLLVSVAIAPKKRVIRTSAERWMTDISHQPPEDHVHLLKRIVASGGKCQETREMVKHEMKKQVDNAAKRLLTAFKCSWRKSSSDTEPPLDWDVYKKNMQPLQKYIDSLESTIPGDMGICMTNPVDWGELVVMYSNYGDTSIERSPNYGDEEKVRAILSRVVPNGKWEGGISRSEKDIECVPPQDAHNYHIISLRDSMQVRLQDLDEVRRTKGQHLTEATKVELVGYKFRFEGRKGAAGLPMLMPCAYDGGKYSNILCRLWSHLNDISDEEAQCISAWSPLHARRLGISNTGKQHTIEHNGLRIRQGIGQPTMDQSQMLMDASTIQLMCRVDDSDTISNEIRDLASQIRCIYALMGIIVNTSSHYAKRRLASGKVNDYAVKQDGIGSLVSRKKNQESSS